MSVEILKARFLSLLLLPVFAIEAEGQPFQPAASEDQVIVSSANLNFEPVYPDKYFNTTNIPGEIWLLHGVPSDIAVLLDSTNFTEASWRSYTSTNFIVHLPPIEGWHEIWVGLREGADDPYPVWQWRRLKFDKTPPSLVITSPPSPIVSQPMIQLKGYSPEDLSEISCDVSNATGLSKDRMILVTEHQFDNELFEPTTNLFQGFDIKLAKGLNLITLRATDRAGNSTATNFSFTLDYSIKTNPPEFKIAWPKSGTKISSDRFTCRGWLDDFTATVTATLAGSEGATNTIEALVERDGKFWIERIPLSNGTNGLSLVVKDAAGNVTSTNISVIRSPVTAGLDEITPPEKLWEPELDLTGTISDTTYSIWINGVKGKNNGDGTWSAKQVPVPVGNTATFDILTYGPDERQPDGSVGN